MSESSDRDQADLEGRLAADGARWRAGQPAPPAPDLDRLAQAVGGRRRPRWQPLAAAAAVVLLGGGAVAVVAGLARPPAGPGPAGGAALTPPRPAPALRDEIPVRDGDHVGAYGQVVAVPGRPVRFCAPTMTLDTGPGGDRPPAYCDVGVTLLGMKLDQLTQRREQAGVVSGEGWVEGTFRAGTLTVTRQGTPPPGAVAEPDSSVPERPPCPEPPGGWAPGKADDNGVNALSHYLEAHPDRYGDIAMTYPGDSPPPSTDPVDRGSNETQVVLVSTVLEPAAAERELRAIFPGNLCVIRIAHNRLAVDEVEERVTLLFRSSPQIFQDSRDYSAGRVPVSVVVLDLPMYEALSRADRGTGIVAAEPLLRRLDR
jgi:hypothetical protein